MKFTTPNLLLVGLLSLVTTFHGAETSLYELWDPALPVPTAAETPLLPNVEFTVLKKFEPEKDGYRWLHGLAIVRHEGEFFVSWGHNKGDENTPTEINQGIRSKDDGKTWSPVEMIAPNTASDGRSHGVFLSHEGTLWLFLGRFGNDEQGRRYARLKTEAFTLNQKTNQWETRGIVADNFWPYQEPVRMADGNWIVSGMIVPAGEWARPGVAISHGEDLTHWDTIEIPTLKDMGIWGETAIFIDGSEILAVIRGGKGYSSRALVSVSKDYGRTWDMIRESNLPMTTSKAYAGVLSTGQRYLICNTVKDHEQKRYPLTIAVTAPHEKLFRRMWRIRDGLRPAAGDKENVALAYPYAIEHDRKLWVVYSTARGPRNQNNAELAVFPISELAVE